MAEEGKKVIAVVDMKRNRKAEVVPTNEIGIDNFCKLLDDDFEEYEEPPDLMCTISEVADDVSDNSDEELIDVGLDLTVHRPLKAFKVRDYQTLSGKFMVSGRPEEMLGYEERESVLLCSVPGVGYLKIFKLDKKNCCFIIEDPFHPGAKHEFFSFVEAGMWLNRILQHFMVFGKDVVPFWILAGQVRVVRKFWHRFDPIILKDKTVMVTKDGLLSLKNKTERTERVYYRRKMMKYANILADLVFSKDDEAKSTLPLSSFLEKVLETVKAEEKRFLRLQYKVYRLTHKRSKLKTQLRAALMTAKEGEDKARGLRMLTELNECMKDPSKNRRFMYEVPVVELSDEEASNEDKAGEASNKDKVEEASNEGEDYSYEYEGDLCESEDNSYQAEEASDEAEEASDEAEEASDEAEEASDEGPISEIPKMITESKSWEETKMNVREPLRRVLKRSERIRQRLFKNKSQEDSD